MSELSRIGSQLKRAAEGEAWHGPGLFEILDGMSAEQATLRPIADVHSIWEILLHVEAWEGFALVVSAG